MKKVYISGPFRGATPWEIVENVRRAERLALRAWKDGHAAFCPHLNTQNFQDSVLDDTFLIGDLVWLAGADELWLCDGWQKSAGTKIELLFALRLCIRCYDYSSGSIRVPILESSLQGSDRYPQVSLDLASKWLSEHHHLLPPAIQDYL
jgi:hypothetical protein